jgi:hypothetical protein
MINIVYLLQQCIFLILAICICSVKKTTLIRGWQLFQEISLHVTPLTDAADATAAAADDDDHEDEDDDGDDDNDNNNVFICQLHGSFAKM